MKLTFTYNVISFVEGPPTFCCHPQMAALRYSATPAHAILRQGEIKVEKGDPVIAGALM